MAPDTDPIPGPKFKFQDIQNLLPELPGDTAGRTNGLFCPQVHGQADVFDPYLSRISRDLLATFAYGRDIVAEIEYGPVLSKVIEKAQTLVDAETASICLMDLGSSTLQQVRIDPASTTNVEFVERDPGVPAPEPLEQGQLLQRQGTCSACKLATHVVWCASADLSAAGQPVGTLCVMRGTDRPPFSHDQMRALEIYAAWAGIAIANAQRVRAARAAALAERERIAAHLHDHAAQNLGLLKLKVEQLERALGDQSVAAAGSQLADVKAISQDILGQVRAAFSELRPAAPANEDLVTALTTCVEAFRETARVPVELTVIGLCSLPPDIQTQALHIVREALVNVRRHAQAQVVRVELARDGDNVRIVVQDDGRGFDLKLIGKDRQHLGTTIMRERAQRSGGSLTIETKPGRGTRVTIQFPSFQP